MFFQAFGIMTKEKELKPELNGMPIRLETNFEEYSRCAKASGSIYEKERCQASMDDDFNTPILISVLFDAVKSINQIKTGQAQIDKENLDLLKELMSDYLFDVLGLQEESGAAGSDNAMDDVMQILIDLRKEARENKDYALSDQIRDRLGASGIQLKDGAEGTSWTKS